MKPYTEQSYYELLEVPPTSTIEEIRAAYERAAQLYDVDSVALYAVGDPARIEELKKLLVEAVEILSDPDLRARYDQALGIAGGTAPAAMVGSASPPAIQARAPMRLEPHRHLGPAFTNSGVLTPAERRDPISLPTALPTPSRASALLDPLQLAAPDPVAAAGHGSAPRVNLAGWPSFLTPAPAPPEPRGPAPAPPASDPAPASPEWRFPPPAARVSPSPSSVIVDPIALAESRPPTVPFGAAEEPGPAGRAPAPRRALESAPVLAQESAIADAESALAQIQAQLAQRGREPRPRGLEVPADAVFNGELIRHIRKAKGMTLQVLADRTRISTRHLENVEADRYDALPATVYLRGFLMNIARELGLDPLRASKGYLALVEKQGGRK
jgi:DNA-binding transcriptional regulator YiaG